MALRNGGFPPGLRRPACPSESSPGRDLMKVFDQIVGESPGIRAALAQAERVAATVFGETGTGKELFATRIHELSARQGRAMVRVNCAAIPSTLIESEQFGRERGAFTGAFNRQEGARRAVCRGVRQCARQAYRIDRARRPYRAAAVLMAGQHSGTPQRRRAGDHPGAGLPARDPLAGGQRAARADGGRFQQRPNDRRRARPHSQGARHSRMADPGHRRRRRAAWDEADDFGDADGQARSDAPPASP